MVHLPRAGLPEQIARIGQCSGQDDDRTYDQKRHKHSSLAFRVGTLQRHHGDLVICGSFAIGSVFQWRRFSAVRSLDCNSASASSSHVSAICMRMGRASTGIRSAMVMHSSANCRYFSALPMELMLRRSNKRVEENNRHPMQESATERPGRSPYYPPFPACVVVADKAQLVAPSCEFEQSAYSLQGSDSVLTLLIPPYRRWGPRQLDAGIGQPGRIRGLLQVGVSRFRLFRCHCGSRGSRTSWRWWQHPWYATFLLRLIQSFLLRLKPGLLCLQPGLLCVQLSLLRLQLGLLRLECSFLLHLELCGLCLLSTQLLHDSRRAPQEILPAHPND
jgi:hypothetical protein